MRGAEPHVDAINFSISLTSRLLLRQRSGLCDQRRLLEQRLRTALLCWRHGPLLGAFHCLRAHAAGSRRRALGSRFRVCRRSLPKGARRERAPPERRRGVTSVPRPCAFTPASHITIAPCALVRTGAASRRTAWPHSARRRTSGRRVQVQALAPRLASGGLPAVPYGGCRGAVRLARPGGCARGAPTPAQCGLARCGRHAHGCPRAPATGAPIRRAAPRARLGDASPPAYCAETIVLRSASLAVTIEAQRTCAQGAHPAP